mgnify:CR=1 FL=1
MGHRGLCATRTDLCEQRAWVPCLDVEVRAELFDIALLAPLGRPIRSISELVCIAGFLQMRLHDDRVSEALRLRGEGTECARHAGNGDRACLGAIPHVVRVRTHLVRILAAIGQMDLDDRMISACQEWSTNERGGVTRTSRRVQSMCVNARERRKERRTALDQRASFVCILACAGRLNATQHG